MQSTVFVSALLLGFSAIVFSDAKPALSADKKVVSLAEATRRQDQNKVQADSTASPKVVSLAPSNTELIYSLQAQNRLVGVSSYCQYPLEARNKPKVGSFVSINWEKLATLKPTVVVLVSGQESLEIQLKKHKIKALILKNESLDDVAKNLITLGSICACEPTAKRMAEHYRQALSELRSIFKDSNKSKVFFCVWPKPIVTVGGTSFLNDVINVCGGSNVVADMKGSYPKVGPEKVIALQPDVLIMPYESRTMRRATTPPWSMLSATKKNQVYFLPDSEHDYLSRPTLRIVKGLLPLCLKLHPERRAELAKWGLKYAKPNCQKNCPKF